MRELEVHITNKSLSKSYKISIDDEFAVVFKKDLALFSDKNGNIDAKDLLEAFVKKSYEQFINAKELNRLIKKIEENR
ncbi:hypothetical protein F1B92_04845 [Campylobacter sp. FMV-PI01]|uniref:Uncharacterized protein n=1 Tax=Campylobacter portucalensis TaxID=2608384 RepID=A0A6L5WH36_9BACT|nr:hypothetical protein [Campylobacter portucalensis]MSN96500.1 hypothetical protein [Campylobacter portucalensis]